MNKRSLIKTFLAAAMLAMAAPASAQFGGTGGTGGRRGGGRQRSDGPADKSGASLPPRIDQLEAVLHEFHEDLKLTPAQEPAWEAYSGKLRALAGDVARERAVRPPPPDLTLLQRIDRAVDLARNRLTALEDIADSAKALYGSLSPEQQKVADPRLANIISIPLAGNGGGAPGTGPRS